MTTKYYLLDTSAIRSLRHEWIVDRQRQMGDLLVSPITLYELICHIDETLRFVKFKNELLKCLSLKILPEPDADIEASAGLISTEIDYHLQIGNLLSDLLQVLKSSSSLEEFYGSSLIDHLGKQRLVNQVAERGRKTLESAASRYEGYITNIIQIIREERVTIDSEQSCHNIILGIYWAYLRSLKLNIESPSSILNLVGNRTYIHCAYVFERAILYAGRVGKKIDPNDYEDSEILLHLSLDDSIILVTDDQGTRRALQSTLDRLVKLQIHISMPLKVISSIELKNSH